MDIPDHLSRAELEAIIADAGTVGEVCRRGRLGRNKAKTLIRDLGWADDILIPRSNENGLKLAPLGDLPSGRR